MKYAHLATRLYNAVLLITPEKGAVLDSIFQRCLVDGAATVKVDGPTKAEALAVELTAQGMQRADGGYWRTTDGVALIPVVGTLLQRGDSLDAASGMIGYNRIAAQLQSALDDPRVDAILLEFDSAGGEASGVVDLAGKISAAAKRKPTWAYANEQAFSAAYWLASSATKIYAPQLGMVGSIGAYMMHQDQSQKDAKAGITYTPIFSGARKLDFDPHSPLSDEARAVGQARINEITDSFVAAIAANRGIDEDEVRGTNAGIFGATAALDSGLIDGIASFDDTLAALSAEAQKFRMRGRIHAAAQSPDELNEEIIMPEASKAATFTAEDIAKARAEGAAEADTKAKAEAKVQADASAKASQERISAILTHTEAQGRRPLAEHLAFKTETKVEDAVALLAASAKETTTAANPLAEAMNKVPNPKVGADGRSEGDAPPKRIKSSAEIFDFRQQCVAKAVAK